MTQVTVAHIEVKPIELHLYSATVLYRPEQGESPFRCPVMEIGPYTGRRHRSAWRKAWRAAGCPIVVERHEL